ncbi:hypothetical protein [Nocardia sp. NPDC057455]|uniref:hypothetical protein n=1 Tax=Nocardia sp. NPDC057455 TaxID=3346138 RepID=UPI00366D0AFC
MSMRDQLAALLAEHLYDRGDYVPDWPEDERDLHRDPDAWNSFDERREKVQRLRFEKAADAILVEFTVVPRFEMVEGGVYRNEHGGELHAIEQTVYLHPGRRWRVPAYVFGEVWLMESRSDEYGTIPYLVTREGLWENGFVLVDSADEDGAE